MLLRQKLLQFYGDHIITLLLNKIPLGLTLANQAFGRIHLWQ